MSRFWDDSDDGDNMTVTVEVKKMTTIAMTASLLKQAMVYCCGVVIDNVAIS